DGLAAASLAGLAGWHAGCLARDACLGAASDVPWAMTQPGSAIGRHPVEIYAAIALAAAAIALSWWRSARHATPGAAAGLALAAAGAVRLLTEPLRPSLTTGPVLWYGAAVVVGLVITRAVRRGVSVTGSGGAAGAAPDRG
ncbi:MAG: hypothetical protein GWO02_20450, partial [Gammaproteobacteria bacterium]|nr:hypothetical protein [Gammaproteobacteria bacterium]